MKISWLLYQLILLFITSGILGIFTDLFAAYEIQSSGNPVEDTVNSIFADPSLAREVLSPSLYKASLIMDNLKAGMPEEVAKSTANDSMNRMSREDAKEAIQNGSVINPPLISDDLSPWWANTEAISSSPTTPEWPTRVIVTEKIPGANCKCDVEGAGKGKDECDPSVKVEERKYICEVGKWLSSFQSLLATIIRYFINIVLLLGVLAIVGAGILMSFWSDSEEYTKKAKWWAINIIIGLIILFAFRYILWLLAPWIYQ